MRSGSAPTHGGSKRWKYKETALTYELIRTQTSAIWEDSFLRVFLGVQLLTTGKVEALYGPGRPCEVLQTVGSRGPLLAALDLKHNGHSRVIHMQHMQHLKYSTPVQYRVSQILHIELTACRQKGIESSDHFRSGKRFVALCFQLETANLVY